MRGDKTSLHLGIVHIFRHVLSTQYVHHASYMEGRSDSASFARVAISQGKYSVSASLLLV